MNKLILFSHHYVNDNIINRINNLKKLNSNWDVVPIGFEGYNLLPDSLIVNKKEYPTNKAISYHRDKENHGKFLDWADPDIFIYDGYRQLPTYDEYFLYEYDTICNVSIDSFFRTDLDFFGNYISSPASEKWYWVEKYRLHNSENLNFPILYGYGASTCIYVNNDILSKCVNEVLTNKHLYCNMLSEIRGGTLVSKFTTLKKGKEDIEKYISWNPTLIDVDKTKDYFYHPIK